MGPKVQPLLVPVDTGDSEIESEVSSSKKWVDDSSDTFGDTSDPDPEFPCDDDFDPDAAESWLSSQQNDPHFISMMMLYENTEIPGSDVAAILSLPFPWILCYMIQICLITELKPESHAETAPSPMVKLSAYVIFCSQLYAEFLDLWNLTWLWLNCRLGRRYRACLSCGYRTNQTFLACGMLVILPKLVFAILLLFYGWNFFEGSSDNVDLILNCTALFFILETDSLIFKALGLFATEPALAKVKDEITRCFKKPAPMCGHESALFVWYGIQIKSAEDMLPILGKCAILLATILLFFPDLASKLRDLHAKYMEYID